MKKRITIIGANSYLARNLIYIIKQKKEEYELFLYDCQCQQIDGAENYKQVNVCCMEEIKELNYAVDNIFVFTGKTGTYEGFEKYEDFIDINEKALLNILTGYRMFGSHAILVFPSTRLVYKGKKGALTEDAENEYMTVYALTKYSCEQYLKMYHQVYGISYSIFRISIPFGSLVSNASSYGTVQFMLDKARKGNNITLFGDGNLRRTVTYIEDLCNMMLLGLATNTCINDVFNIGGEDYSLLEMAQLIAQKYQVKVELVPWIQEIEKIESGNTVFCSEKLDQRIDYRRMMTFKDWISQIGSSYERGIP